MSIVQAASLLYVSPALVLCVLNSGYLTDTTDSSSETSSPKGKRRRTKIKHDVPSIIGTKKFLLDDILLDDHLASVLEWWHGVRQPKGVEVEQSKRCL
jgi:exonuclease V